MFNDEFEKINMISSVWCKNILTVERLNSLRVERLNLSTLNLI